MRYWVLKGIPGDSDSHEWLRRGALVSTGTNHRLVEMRPEIGDRCFWWNSAPARQLVGLGTITGVTKGKRKRTIAHVRFDTSEFVPPLTLQELKGISELKELSFLNPGYSATFYAVPEAAAELMYQISVASVTGIRDTWADLPQASARSRKCWKRIASRREDPYRVTLKAPKNDSGRKQLVARRVRAGQQQFRRLLFQACGSRCEITGCTVPEVLDACHIRNHSRGGTYDPSNGLLLRTDLHALFDDGLIRIHPQKLTVSCDKSLQSTSYWSLHGRKLNSRADGTRPGPKHLKTRWQA